jgi:hypothetical protein
MTRDRGTYGPLDRDRHFVVGWGADEAAGYVRDHTLGAVLRPALPVIDDVFAARRGFDRWWTASRALGGRDAAARPMTAVGQELIHTVADRDRAIMEISTGFRALANDLAVWQTANMQHPDASVNAQWMAADVTPTLEEWNVFVEHEKRSWWSKLATSWETFENWFDRLKQLRQLARARGITLESAEPKPLPQTIWQRSEEGKGSEATAVLGVLKIAALSVVAVMGAAGLYGAIHNLHRRSHPIDREELREVLHEEMEAEKRHKKR